MRRFAFLFFSPLLLSAEDPDPFFLEKLLPENTLLYLSIPNNAGVSEDYQKSTLHRLLQHPEVKSFLEPLEAYVAKRRKEEDKWRILGDETWRKMTGLTLEEIWELARGPIAFAILDLPLNEEHTLDVVLSVGNPDPARLKDAASKVAEVVKKESQNPLDSESTFKGVPIRAFGGRELTIYSASIGKTYFFTTQESRIHQIITASVEKGTNSLETSNSFRTARERISPRGRHFLLAYLNGPAILKNFRKELGDAALGTLESMGVSDLTGLALGLSFEDGVVRERGWVGTSSQTRGIPRLLVAKSSGNSWKKLAPSGAVVHAHFPVDLRDVYDLFHTGLELDPDSKKEFDREVPRFESRVGFRVRDDLLASIGSGWSQTSVLPEGGGIVPDTYFVVPIVKESQFQECLRKIATDLKTSIREVEFHGQKIFLVDISFSSPSDPLRYGPVPSLTLTWCFRGGNLVLSNSAHAIQRMVLRSGPSLEENPKFRESRGRLASDSEPFAYVDFARLFLCGYNTLEPLLHFAREFVRDETGTPILDLARLPLGETLAEAIGTSCSARRIEAGGLLFESASPVGLTPISLATIAGAGAVSLLLSRRVEPPGGIAENERVAQTRLRWIVQAQVTFQQSDSDGNLTQDFWTRDVAGLYAFQGTSGQKIYLIDPQTAQADPQGAQSYESLRGTAQPANGYYFRSLVTDADGEKYAQDTDGDGNAWTNLNRFAICAYPEVYGVTGRMTFLVSEMGVIYKKDTEGQVVESWPGPDPEKEGWSKAD